MQNNSVAHYPTNILRQLYFAPWAEFAIMHLQILCGGADYCANLIQWFSLCGCIVGASLIAEQLGADRYRQIFAAVITATLPMGILQSSSTQNDLVAAFWLVCFVHFGIAFLENREIRTAIPAGFALSLAILTKGTAYLYALPYIAWFILALIRSNKRHLLHVALVTSMAIIFLNGGHYVRNTALWGNPLAMDFDHVQTTRRDLPSLLSNISRNLAVNTWTPFPVVSVLQYNIMVRVHDILGIDISDPATTLGAPFVPAPLSFHEDTAGNGLHTLLLLSALPVVFPLLRRNTTTNTLRYTVSLLGSIMLVSFLIKWQPWITRLQTPGFMLAAPLISVAMPGAQRTWIVRTAMTILVLAAVPWLVCNESRPLIGPWSILGVERNALYFANNSGLLPYYDQVTEEVAATPSCGTIEVYGNVDAYEYPFWALVRSKSKSMPRIEHSNVDNISRSISLIDFTPCMQVKLLQVP
jgi:4-amino-4-deoxy-L-arabinose transferase-like glycosyltransferase